MRSVEGLSRLEAYKWLGKNHIPVTYFGTLSEEEREDLELEENIRRKNLTPYEKSKLTMREKKQAAKEVQEAQDLSAHRADKSEKKKPWRPKKPDSKDAVADKAGKPRSTIGKAEAHVAACEKYPFLQGPLWKQKPALEMAKMLDEIGEKDVEYLNSWRSTVIRSLSRRVFFFGQLGRPFPPPPPFDVALLPSTLRG